MKIVNNTRKTLSIGRFRVGPGAMIPDWPLSHKEELAISAFLDLGYLKKLDEEPVKVAPAPEVEAEPAPVPEVEAPAAESEAEVQDTPKRSRRRKAQAETTEQPEE